MLITLMKYLIILYLPEKLLEQYEIALNTIVPEDINYYNEFCYLVKQKGGTMISKEDEYKKTAHSKLKVKCKINHDFITSLNIAQKAWCPTCSTRKTEKYIKFIVELLLNKKCVKIRPKWLENLELDIYCEELKLAFEYNGIQHYKIIEHFNMTEDTIKKTTRKRSK